MGFNRDERYTKQWDDISNHWEQYPDIFGYRDHDTGGTWFAYNHSLIAVLINRECDRYKQFNSRSKIVLMTLQSACNINGAVDNLLKIDTSYYKPFNIIILNNKDVVWATNYYDNKINNRANVRFMDEELILINRSFPNDLRERRISQNRNNFYYAKEPNPNDGYWSDWEQLLTTECFVDKPHDERCLWLNSKQWGTLLSEIIAMPRQNHTPPVIHRVKTR